MADERRPHGHNGEERRRGERRREASQEGERGEPPKVQQPDPGMLSRRSDIYEGWNDRDRHAEGGNQWSKREQDRGDEYGALHREEGAPPDGPWRSEDYPEYGGRVPRPSTPMGTEGTEGRAYTHAEPPFPHRERPGYQANPGERGLGMRHKEHMVNPGLDEGLTPRERGGFAGRGPRGYRRSDDRIWEDVCEHLTHASSVDASRLDVTVERGEVTLEGSVHSREMKRRAEHIAEQVAGVVDVHNRLRIRPRGE